MDELTEGQRQTLDAIREMARGWSLETQAKIIRLRMSGGIEPPPSEEDIVAALRTMDEVEGLVR